MLVSAAEIARSKFALAMAEAKVQGQDPDAVARQMLSMVIASMLERRSVRDVRAEILAAADNVDPDTDYMFMRP